jgi:hypothetical protein
MDAAAEIILTVRKHLKAFLEPLFSNAQKTIVYQDRLGANIQERPSEK